MPAVAPFAQGCSRGRCCLAHGRSSRRGYERRDSRGWRTTRNVDEGFDRNYLRLRVLPLIRDRWPGSATAVARSARHAAEAQSLLDTLARADIDRASYGESLSIKSLRALPPDRLRNALRFWITRAGLPGPRHKAPRRDYRAVARRAPRRESVCGVGRGGGECARAAPWRSLSLGPRASSRASSPAATTPADAACTPSATTLADAAHTHTSASASPTAYLALVWSWHDSLVYDLPHDLGKLELRAR